MSEVSAAAAAGIAAETGGVTFADHAWSGSALVVENVRMARDTYRLRLDCPAIARRIAPGQFLMLRLPGRNDPLLGRPFALYDTIDGDDGQPRWLDVVYLVVGKVTRRLAEVVPGESLELWGPLGNGFAPVACRRLVMAVGGIGQTPMLALAKRALGLRSYGGGAALRGAAAGLLSASQITLCYGARSADLLAGVEDFQRLGIDVRLSTDDGTRGHQGRVTDTLEQVFAEHGTDGLHVVSCGPEPMMHAVAERCLARGVPCELSLETPMACGIGICFSCVAKVRQADGSWDYRRTCVEGPVFDAAQIVFA